MTPNEAPRPLGRNTLLTVQHWDKIVETVPVLPRMVCGAPLRKSPNVRNFHHRSFLNQNPRGFCVGFNTCGTVMTRLRIPAGATPDSPPLPLTALSPLWVYDVSRLEARNEGINLGWGDGSIGSCAIKGVHGMGVVLLQDYSSTPSDVSSHRNNTDPRQNAAATSEGKQHLVVDIGIAQSFQDGMSLLSAGIPVALSSDIPSGMMNTDAKGFFRMTGAIVGGHCFQWIDYDQDQNLAWIAQAWLGWGPAVSTDPDHQYPDTMKTTQIGTCPLDELESFFSDRSMSSGSSEICAANTVQGWQPAISYNF